MKVYVTGSSLLPKNQDTLRGIVDILRAERHEVFTNVFSKERPTRALATEHLLSRWHEEWSSYVASCDCAVIEASYPSSVHIGFEIGMIAMRGKPIVVLYEEGADPVFVDPRYTSRVIKSPYTQETLVSVIPWCMNEVKHAANRRFAFYISPEIDDFLADVVEDDGESRAEYIRKLIEREMKKRR